jgi:hypothetical protein
MGGERVQSPCSNSSVEQSTAKGMLNSDRLWRG